MRHYVHAFWEAWLGGLIVFGPFAAGIALGFAVYAYVLWRRG